MSSHDQWGTSIDRHLYCMCECGETGPRGKYNVHYSVLYDIGMEMPKNVEKVSVYSVNSNNNIRNPIVKDVGCNILLLHAIITCLVTYNIITSLFQYRLAFTLHV